MGFFCRYLRLPVKWVVGSWNTTFRPLRLSFLGLLYQLAPSPSNGIADVWSESLRLTINEASINHTFVGRIWGILNTGLIVCGWIGWGACEDGLAILFGAIIFSWNFICARISNYNKDLGKAFTTKILNMLLNKVVEICLFYDFTILKYFILILSCIRH